MAQQWQAAPCRKSSGSFGVRFAQMGSEEHRVARPSAVATIRRFALVHQAAERAIAVRRGGDDQQARGRSAAVGLGPCVQPPAQAGGGVTAAHGELANEHMGEGMDEPVPGRLETGVGMTSDGRLGDPIEITADADIRQIERIRRAVFGGGDNRPLQHLGEAQSCYVILNWAEFAGSWWITNDRDALRYAKFQHITTRETMDLMCIAVVNGDITARDAFTLMTRMIDAGRHLRLPQSPAELAR